MQRILLGLTVCLSIVVLPNAVQAQRGGYGGGGFGRDCGYGYGRGGFGYGCGGFGFGIYPGYYYGGFGPYYGYGDIGYGGYPYAPGLVYPPTALVTPAPNAVAPAVPPPALPASGDGPTILTATTLGNTANIRVTLPTAEAQLFIDGAAVTSTGVTRILATPELKPGATYQYELTAQWQEGSRTISEKRRVEVAPGGGTVVDFTRAAPRP